MSTESHLLVEQLYKENNQQLQRFLMGKFGNEDQAKEIAHEAYVRIQRLDAPSKLENPRAFLFKVAANLATDFLRHKNLENRHFQTELQRSISGLNHVESPDPADELIAQERLRQINDTLSSMPAKAREAFLLHRRQGMSYAEIAEQMGVSVSSIEKYILTALRHFRTAK